MLPAVAIALVVLVRGVSFATVRASAPWLALAGLIAAAVLMTRGALLGTAYEPFAGLIISQLGIDPALAYPLSVENQAMLFCRYFATWLMPWPGWLAIALRTPFPRALLAWPYSAGFALWLAYAALATWLLMQRGLRGLAGFALLFPWLLGLTEMATVRLQEPFGLYRRYLWMAGLPAALPALVAPLPPRGPIAALVVLFALLAAGPPRALGHLPDPVALWDDAARKNHAPGAPFAERPYVSRGLAHMERGSNEAFADFDRALRMNPRS